MNILLRNEVCKTIIKNKTDNKIMRQQEQQMLNVAERREQEIRSKHLEVGV